MGTIELANSVKRFLDNTPDKQDEDLQARIDMLKRSVETNIELILSCDHAQFEELAIMLVKLKRAFAAMEPEARGTDKTKRMESHCRGLDDLLIETEQLLGRKSLGTLNMHLDEPPLAATRLSRDRARIRSESALASRREASSAIPPITLTGARLLSPRSPGWRKHYRLIRPSSPRSPRSPIHIRSAHFHLRVKQAKPQA